MSYYDDSSLFLSPNGYKTSVLFAQKPMDANGQLAFTRSNSTATRVGPNGLIEKVRTNTLLHSEAFDNAVYGKGVGGSVVANTVVAPDGTMTADAYTWATATATYAYLTQSVAGTSQIPNTFSIYIKRPAGSGSRTLRLAVTDVTISTTFGSNITVTESWQRFELARTSASTTGNVGIGLMTGSTGVSIAGGEVLHVWGAQLETGDIATDYIPTTTAAVSVGPVANLPRIDYTGGGCGKLLLEPQRTNSLLQADTISSSAFTYNLCSQTSNVIGVDGYNSGRRIQNGGTASDAYFERSVTTATGVWTWSIFVKQGTAAAAQIRPVHVGIGGDVSFVTFTFATKTLVNSAIILNSGYQEYGNGWFRIFCSVNITGAVTSLRARYSNNNVANAYNDWAFPQLEFGSYVTSYIPTLGAAVTRGADAASKTGISSLIGDSEGWIYGEVQGLTNSYGGLSTILSVSDGTLSNRVQFSFNALTNYVTPRIFRAGSTIFVNDIILNANNRFKFAIQYSGTTAVCYINGENVASTSGLTFFSAGTLSKIAFNDGTGSQLGYGRISQVLIGQTALTNAELAQLTTI